MMQNTKLVLIAVIVGCVFTQSFAKSIEDLKTRSKRSLDDAEAEPKQAKEKAKGKPKKGGAGGGAAGNGTADAIRADPESSQRYSEFGQKNFEGFQDIMNKHFDKRKKEGDAISAHGDKTKKEAEDTQVKFEEGHYTDMNKGFKWAEKSMKDAAKDMELKEGDTKEEASAPPKGGTIDSNNPGNRRNAKGGADNKKKTAEAPAKQPVVEDDQEENNAVAAIDESDEEI